MLKTQIDCLPNDFKILFQFIDVDDDGLITLDQVRKYGLIIRDFSA